jgi:hypothetical protein
MNAAYLRSFLIDMSTDASKRVLLSLETKGYIFRDVTPRSPLLYTYWVNGYLVTCGSRVGSRLNIAKALASKDVTDIEYVQSAPESAPDCLPLRYPQSSKCYSEGTPLAPDFAPDGNVAKGLISKDVAGIEHGQSAPESAPWGAPEGAHYYKNREQRTNNNVVDSVSSMEENPSPSEEEMIEWLQKVKDQYCEITGESPNSFHPKQDAMGLARFREALEMRHGNLEEAAELMIGVIDSVDRWPKRSRPVRWDYIFADADKFGNWVENTNIKLDRRPAPTMPKTQEEIDAQKLNANINQAARLCQKPTGPDWTLGQQFGEDSRVWKALRRHVADMPVSDAVAILNGLATGDDVRAIVGPVAIPEPVAIPDAQEWL